MHGHVLQYEFKNQGSSLFSDVLVHCTMDQNNQKYRLTYWVTRSSIRSFARMQHSLVHLLRTTRFSCTLCWARLLTFFTPPLLGQWMIKWLFFLCFSPFWTIVHWWHHWESMKILKFVRFRNHNLFAFGGMFISEMLFNDAIALNIQNGNNTSGYLCSKLLLAMIFK